MPELRWTLLALGVLFIGALTWWERRKPRQAARSPTEPTVSEMPASRVHREPTLTLPEMRAREPTLMQDLPVVDIADDESLSALRSDDRRVAGEVVRDEAAQEEISPGESPPPVLPEPPVLRAESAAEPHDDPDLPTLSVPAEPIVEWPPDEQRQILALRIVSVSPERFAGRVVRTALVAEGFKLGKYSIFHKPDAAGRAVLSVASLSKPGNFDLDTIDTQRFGGLSLFAVLPGPKAARDAFEELLAASRNLNERLHGGLQDERGGPLTPGRIAALREGLAGGVQAQGPEEAT